MTALADKFTYDAASGNLVWKPRAVSEFTCGKYPAEREAARWNSRYAGKPAGTSHPSGYMKVCGKYLHRVVWEWHHGPISAGMQVDHINGNRADNRIENLRLASAKENARNKRSRKGSSSQFLGVSWIKAKQKWVAQIQHNNAVTPLGHYDDERAAALAYNAAAAREYGAFANLNAV